MAHLIKQLLPTPEMHSLNHSIGKISSTNAMVHLPRNDENEEKEAGNDTSFKKHKQQKKTSQHGASSRNSIIIF